MPCPPCCVICVICGRIFTQEYSINPHKWNPRSLPQISLIYADKPQNHKTALTSPICLSLRYNAACCIPLRDLRYLRENTHPNLLNLYTQMKPQYLPLITQIIADEPQNNKTSKHQTTTTTRTLARTHIGFWKIPASKCLYIDYQHNTFQIFIIEVTS